MPSLSPGECIRRELAARNWSQADLEKITKITSQEVSDLLSGKLSITSEMAIRLGETFGTSAEFWNRLEKRFSEKLPNLSQGDAS